MRFDDSLETVLSAEMSTPFGAQSAWRQLVDLIGRCRIPAEPSVIARLKEIRAEVPPPVRAASARALAFASPPFALVQLFADDELSIAAPVLRIAVLQDAEWIDMLPGLSPSARSILRHRRDLGAEVRRALDSFGTVDFVLPSQGVAAEVAAQPEQAVVAAEPDEALLPIDPSPLSVDWTEMVPVEEPAPSPVVTEVPVAEVPLEELQIEQPSAVAEIPDVAPKEDAVADTIIFAPLAMGLATQSYVEPVPLDLAPGDAALPPVEQPAAPAEPLVPSVITADDVAVAAQLSPTEAAPAAELPTLQQPPVQDTPFVSISSVALGLPVVAEALRRAATEEQAEAPATPDISPTAAPTIDAEPVPVPALPPLHVVPTATSVAPEPATGPFQISDLVARIDAYHRRRDESPADSAPEQTQPALFDLEVPQAQSFRFETDAAGVVRWIEGAARAPLIGLSLDLAALPSGSRIDGVAAGAFRRRAGFSNARLIVDGNSDAAGDWRITGIPVFDHANGRFTGYRGSARRPRADESADPVRGRGNAGAEALRQLVHELRTPTNAIAGFAEMIEGELLGPVPRAYRDHAGTIRSQASDLLVAIDDIDLAARLETHALDLRPGEVPVEPLLARIADDLAPLATLRATRLQIGVVPEGLAISGDDRAVERLIARLCATLVSAGSAGEAIGIAVQRDGDATLAIVFDRPRALAAFVGDAVLAIDAEREAEAEGAPLLGTGFALRLARNLAVELGGALAIGDDRLTLRLPAAVSEDVEQVSSS